MFDLEDYNIETHKDFGKAGIYLSPNGDKQKVQCKVCKRVFNGYYIEETEKETD